ncbi:hypothetical protein ILUMI_11623 [Ignelater luminosus]|uniref:Uncharacterized protein n=1 Tax=Ignelater luminosus TaxID=2038154 RepID=A0A8K0D4M4_IGNLU|nr:hypothetical protein ILUMI_11623 [Ignelater luminosus]
MSKVREDVKYEKQYTEENVLLALEAIENGMSQRNLQKHSLYHVKHYNLEKAASLPTKLLWDQALFLPARRKAF